MERGVYFDAWFPRQHCYHPSLPPRRLRMIDDLVDYHATMLVWSALGGGSISLPYLEEEAFGTIDPRFRFYGFVNDSEFIAHCRERGIKVFGIIFEAQGWDLPAELDEDGAAVLALNEERGAGAETRMGLSSFSRDEHPAIWRPLAHYFPEGLVNSDGERVADLFDECCSRSIDGTPLRARWVEAPDRDHVCRYMDTNNPVWREYLKAIVRIQIDAGVAGIQFDETSTPLGTFQYGGCFCKDCMKGFARHLGELRAQQRLPELADVGDLAGFDYGAWLRRQGLDMLSRGPETPLFWEYVAFQTAAAKDAFAELVEYTRAYAAEQGRDVQVCGNFFNVFPYYDALIPYVDVIVTEMRNTLHRQPAWFRYVAGAAGDKDVVVVENPYGGIVPELVEELGRGRGRDRLRLSLYEAAAMGVNMSVPYGSWMGSTVQDSFYAPHELLVEVQDFVARAEPLSGAATAHEVAVLFSVSSTVREVIARDSFADFRDNESREEVQIPFWEVANLLAESAVPVDVVVAHDGIDRDDDFSAEMIAGYRTVVVPGCHTVSARQLAALREYAGAGGRVVVYGAFAESAGEERERVLERAERVDAPTVAALVGSPQVRLPDGVDVATTIRRLDDGFAVHLVNYAFDGERDAVIPAVGLELSVRLPGEATRATLHRPGRAPTEVALRADGAYLRAVIDELATYGILHVHR